MLNQKMKVYVWVRIEKCTDNYHEDGGVVVIAESEERARELANKKEGCFICEDEKPEIVGFEEKVFIMPNAGCC